VENPPVKEVKSLFEMCMSLPVHLVKPSLKPPFTAALDINQEPFHFSELKGKVRLFSHEKPIFPSSLSSLTRLLP
jgi:hypothetical protein